MLLVIQISTTDKIQDRLKFVIIPSKPCLAFFAPNIANKMANDKISIITVESATNVVVRLEEDQGKEEEEEVEVIENDTSFWNFLHIVTIICTTAIILSPQMLIPRHNSIIYPAYWFEFPLLSIYYAMVGPSALMCSIYVFTGQSTILAAGTYIKIFLWYLFFGCLPSLTTYYLWVIVADMNHPMPFLVSIKWYFW